MPGRSDSRRSTLRRSRVLACRLRVRVSRRSRVRTCSVVVRWELRGLVRACRLRVRVSRRSRVRWCFVLVRAWRLKAGIHGGQGCAVRGCDCVSWWRDGGLSRRSALARWRGPAVAGRSSDARSSGSAQLLHQLRQRHELADVHPTQQRHLEVIARMGRGADVGFGFRQHVKGAHQVLARKPLRECGEPLCSPSASSPSPARAGSTETIIRSRTNAESSRHTSLRS